MNLALDLSAPQIVFRLGVRRCALPLAQVREVVLPGRLTRIPRAPTAVRGAMNVRGRAVLVVDLGQLLDGAACGVGLPAERILVLEPRSRDLGVWVSEVVAITQLGGVGGEPRPPEHLPERLAEPLAEPPPLAASQTGHASRASPSGAPAQPLDAVWLSERVEALFSVAIAGRSPMLSGQPLGR